MAVQGSVIDYTGGAERNYTVFIKLAFTGSYVANGDPLNLTSTGTLPLLNPSGLEIEGFSELPLTLGPTVYIQNILGYNIQPSISANIAGAFAGLTLGNVPIMIYIPAGTELGVVAYSGIPAFVNGTVILSMMKRRV